MANQRELLALPSVRAGRTRCRRSAGVLLAARRACRTIGPLVVDGSRVIVADTRRVISRSPWRAASCPVDLPSAPARRGFDRGGQRGVRGHHDPRPGAKPAEIHALDVAGGFTSGSSARSDRFHPVLKVGDGRLVLFPLKTETAAVHDLFTGFPASRPSRRAGRPRARPDRRGSTAAGSCSPSSRRVRAVGSRTRSWRTSSSTEPRPGASDSTTTAARVASSSGSSTCRTARTAPAHRDAGGRR